MGDLEDDEDNNESEDLEDEDKSIIVELGIKALKGEHLDI